MAVDWLTFIVRTIHILAGVAWVGGGLYAGLVVGRTMVAAPPGVGGPAMSRIGPVGYKYLVWAGVVTIVFGIINQVLIMQSGAVGSGTAMSREWNMVIGIALILAVGMMGIAGAIIGPSIKKMAKLAPPPGQPAPPEMGALQAKLMKGSMASVALGVLATILMVYATKLRVF